MKNKYAMYSTAELAEMWKFYSLSPKNKQAQEMMGETFRYVCLFRSFTEWDWFLTVLRKQNKGRANHPADGGFR